MSSRRDESGSVTLWMVTATFVMMMSVGLAVDLGGQVHAQQRARDLAAQAARAGGQEVQAAAAIEGRYVQIDSVNARRAAEEYLDAAGVAGDVSIAGGDTITVRVTTRYVPEFLGFIGVRHLDVTGTASARLIRTHEGTER